MNSEETMTDKTLGFFIFHFPYSFSIEFACKITNMF